MAITRAERKLIAVCALALFIPLGVAAFIGHINATPTIAATSPVKPPNPNGYDFYARASNAIKPANPAVDAILDLKIITNPKTRAQRYSVARKDAWLKQNKAGFSLFERAQKMDSLAPPIYQGGRNSPSSALRHRARYKTVESTAHWQRGDPHAALQSGLDILQMGYDVQRGGDLMSYLVGNALRQMAIRTTGDTIEHLNAQQARAAARRVEQLLATRWSLDKALIQEKARVSQGWLKHFATPDWRANFARDHQQMSATWGTPPLTWKQRCLIHVTSKRRVIADLDTVYERAIFNARLPYAIEGKPQIATGNPFIDSIYGHLARNRFNSARAQTADRVLMLRFALRAHQLEHNGALPPNLQALVPSYIRSVPFDPFGKSESLRYKTDGKTYALWSIGPDGRDDGGEPMPWFKKAPKRYADERQKLPFIYDDTGDYVAGKNH